MDQDKVHDLKKEMKGLNKEMKEERKKGNMQKSKDLMSESMKLSSKQMHMTMKPMLASLVIVAILLPFLHTYYTDVIIPQNQTNVTLQKEIFDINAQDNVVDIGEKTCELPCRIQINKDTWDITKEDKNFKFQKIVALLPASLPFFGDDFGWLAWYFIVSIPFMIIIRKLMGIKI